MKASVLTSSTLLFLLPLTILVSCSKTNGFANNNATNNAFLFIDTLPKEPVSTAEINSLLHMREEEKLARDVYLYLSRTWGSRVFTNISGSEQRHMDAMLQLLRKYDISDPAANQAEGVFQNKELQELYQKLILKGGKSVAEAFQVGALIEDLDLFDLSNDLKNIDNRDIQLVYENLKRGSRNHMRAFTQNLTAIGITYVPQYISQEEYKIIIEGEMERGNGGW